MGKTKNVKFLLACSMKHVKIVGFSLLDSTGYFKICAAETVNHRLKCKITNC
jgi:hypothetical protein